MSALLRIGGVLLILGSLTLVVEGYAALEQASMVAARGGLAQSNPVWVNNAHWIGIALMMTGLLAAFAALFLFIKTYWGRESGDKLSISLWPVQTTETKQEKG